LREGWIVTERSNHRILLDPDDGRFFRRAGGRQMQRLAGKAAFTDKITGM
jgi:hypothetical protein